MKAKLEALASLIADYRDGEIARPDADHVGRWAAQFEADARETIVEELHQVWSKLYVSRAAAQRFLANLITNEKLAGSDPKSFWSLAHVMDIQANGGSQSDLRILFASALRSATGLALSGCGGGRTYVYLDDVLFTGGRIQHDLKAWLSSAPASASVEVILFAHHRLGQWQTERELKSAAAAAGKAVQFRFWRGFELENRKAERRNADVLWPVSLPAEAASYDQGKFPFVAREPGGSSSLFSSEAKRHVLEQAFIKAGLRIRGFAANPKPIIRPLGYSPYGVGFGSLSLSYRNCPNNAPLALWWGDPRKPSWHPLSKWYPLVPRKTYGNDAF